MKHMQNTPLSPSEAARQVEAEAERNAPLYAERQLLASGQYAELLLQLERRQRRSAWLLAAYVPLCVMWTFVWGRDPVLITGWVAVGLVGVALAIHAVNSARRCRALRQRLPENGDEQ